MLKCSDLHKLASAMCYITRRLGVPGLRSAEGVRSHGKATCGTLLTSEYLLTFPFRLEQTPYSHLASKVRYFHVTPLALAMRTVLRNCAVDLSLVCGEVHFHEELVLTKGGVSFQLGCFFLLGCLHASRTLKRKLPPKMQILCVNQRNPAIL